MALLAGYGVLELKQAYRKNMLIGILAACLLHLSVIGATMIITGLNSTAPEPIGEIVIPSAAELGPPPTLSAEEMPVRIIAPERAAPSVGVPVPVPDEEAPEEVEVATMDDLANLVSMEPVIKLDEVADRNIVIENLEDLLPSPDEFVPYEEAPVIIEQVDPVYPPMAQRAGITDIIWVKALVDKDGRVKDVKIVKSSGANAGFEEAAIEAAMATQWKPAISNGQPVAVWTTYRIIFKLRDR
jgi:protein TonB